MDGRLGFNGILSMQVAAISWLREFNFIRKANAVYKRNYSFRTTIMEEIFQIRNCIEILANDIKIDTTVQYMFYS